MHIYIIYELRNREYDNALLLKSELEKRHYHVEILCKTETVKFRFKEAIILVPNCYNDENLQFYRYVFNTRNNLIINLQYEQIFGEKDLEAGFLTPSGLAMKVHHLCWGMDRYNYLKDKGIEAKYLHIVGAIQLDFLRKEFSDFYLSREQIAAQYNLDLNKKWILYISSFAVNNEEMKNNGKKMLESKGIESSIYTDLFEISVKSQKETFNWFKKILKNDDYIIIYRNHPAEANNSVLNDFDKTNKNFYNISDFGIKQWIFVSDIITTWFSTSIIECYNSEKPCYILRPYPIPKDIDASIYKGAIIQSDIDEFIHYLEKEPCFPMNLKLLEKYYDINNQTPSYIRIANEIDKLNKNKLNYEGNALDRYVYILKHHFIFKIIFKKIYQFIYSKCGFKIHNINLRKKLALNEWERNAIKQKEKDIIIEKTGILRKIVERGKTFQ